MIRLHLHTDGECYRTFYAVEPERDDEIRGHVFVERDAQQQMIHVEVTSAYGSAEVRRILAALIEGGAA